MIDKKSTHFSVLFHLHIIAMLLVAVNVIEAQNVSESDEYLLFNSMDRFHWYFTCPVFILYRAILIGLISNAVLKNVSLMLASNEVRKCFEVLLLF